MKKYDPKYNKQNEVYTTTTIITSADMSWASYMQMPTESMMLVIELDCIVSKTK